MKLRHKQSGEIFEIVGPVEGTSEKLLLIKTMRELSERKALVPRHVIDALFEKIPEPGDSDYIGPFRYAGPIKPKRKYTRRKKHEKEGVSSKV